MESRHWSFCNFDTRNVVPFRRKTRSVPTKPYKKGCETEKSNLMTKKGETKQTTPKLQKKGKSISSSGHQKFFTISRDWQSTTDHGVPPSTKDLCPSWTRTYSEVRQSSTPFRNRLPIGRSFQTTISRAFRSLFRNFHSSHLTSRETPDTDKQPLRLSCILLLGFDYLGPS